MLGKYGIILAKNISLHKPKTSLDIKVVFFFRFVFVFLYVHRLGHKIFRENVHFSSLSTRSVLFGERWTHMLCMA